MYSDPHCKDFPPCFAGRQPEGITEVVLTSGASSGWADETWVPEQLDKICWESSRFNVSVAHKS